MMSTSRCICCCTTLVILKDQSCRWKLECLHIIRHFQEPNRIYNIWWYSGKQIHFLLFIAGIMHLGVANLSPATEASEGLLWDITPRPEIIGCLRYLDKVLSPLGFHCCLLLFSRLLNVCHLVPHPLCVLCLLLLQLLLLSGKITSSSPKNIHRSHSVHEIDDLMCYQPMLGRKNEHTRRLSDFFSTSNSFSFASTAAFLLISRASTAKSFLYALHHVLGRLGKGKTGLILKDIEAGNARRKN